MTNPSVTDQVAEKTITITMEPASPWMKSRGRQIHFVVVRTLSPKPAKGRK